MLTHAFPVSDKGQAQWYRESMHALGHPSTEDGDDD